MDVGNFVRHLCVLVLRHQMRVSNYFVNSFYSVAAVAWCGDFGRPTLFKAAIACDFKTYI